MKYIAFLRGINVSGQKLIKMEDLKSACEKSGLKNVKTYIQSGNIIFDSPMTSDDVRSHLEKLIMTFFGFDVKVIVLIKDELKKIIEENPFEADKNNKIYLVFLSDNPSKELLHKFENIDYAPEKFVIGNKVIFFYCPNGYGKAKLNNNLFETKLNVIATTRNLRTAKELLRLATV